MKQEDLERLRHENRMLEIKEEMEAKIKVEELKFDFALQLQRIKSAEIRKNLINQYRRF